MQDRYDANWYGYLARQRLEALRAVPPKEFGADSEVGKAIANLKTISVAEETAGAGADAAMRRADELDVIGLDQEALSELDHALSTAPRSPRLNLAKIGRAHV